MSENVKLLSPEQKHFEANSARNAEVDITTTLLFQTVARAINSSSGVVENTPVTIFGITTKEYVIIPVPGNIGDGDMTLVRVMQHLRSEGWYCENFYISESMENVTKYGRAIVVSWDPKVLQKSYAPYCYNRDKNSRVPCGTCAKHREGTIAKCGGCLTLRLWLPGVYTLKNYGDPCLKCVKGGNKKSVPSCDGCPAKDLWLSLRDKGLVSDASQSAGQAEAAKKEATVEESSQKEESGAEG